MKIYPVGAKSFHANGTDRHGEANSRFTKDCPNKPSYPLIISQHHPGHNFPTHSTYHISMLTF